MTKRQVIEKTVAEMGGGDETVIAELERRLPEGEDIKTCGDFAHLSAKCCHLCHGNHAMYDMEVVPVPKGGYAWVCCTVDFAIRPEWHAEQERLFLQSEGPESKHDAEMLRVAPYPWFVKQRLLWRRRHLRWRRRRKDEPNQSSD